MQLGRICAQCVRGDKTYRLQITLCFRWRGGAVRLPPRQAHFLHRPLQYIKTPKDGPLPKYSQSLQSAKTPHSQPSLSPIHYWWHSLGNAGTRYRRARKGRTRGEVWSLAEASLNLNVPCFCAPRRTFSRFLFRSVQHAGYCSCGFKHATSVSCRRPDTPVRILRSKCIGNEYPCCVHVQFHQSRRSARLWNRHDDQNQEKALYQSERHARHSWLP